MNVIHPTAVVSPSAKMGTGNLIGAYSVIGDGIIIGDDNWVGSHVVIGTPPEHRRFHNRAQKQGIGVGVNIGDGNIIHEFVSIQLGTEVPTEIKNDCMLMAKVNIGHDSIIENEVTLSTGVSVGGHVHIKIGATIGLGSSIHQNTYIGAFAMIGMGSKISKDVPPFALIADANSRQVGVNEVGIRRSNFFGDWIADYWRLVRDESLPELHLPIEVEIAFSDWKERSKMHHSS